jgi:hypothetical protein
MPLASTILRPICRPVSRLHYRCCDFVVRPPGDTAFSPWNDFLEPDSLASEGLNDLCKHIVSPLCTALWPLFISHFMHRDFTSLILLAHLRILFVWSLYASCFHLVDHSHTSTPPRYFDTSTYVSPFASFVARGQFVVWACCWRTTSCCRRRCAPVPCFR